MLLLLASLATAHQKRFGANERDNRFMTLEGARVYLARIYEMNVTLYAL